MSTTDGTPTIRALLAATHLRDSSMREELAPFTDRPLTETIADLRHELGQRRIDLEKYRRLHILISHLYHRCGADIPQTVALRVEVNRALRVFVYGEVTHREEGSYHTMHQP